MSTPHDPSLDPSNPDEGTDGNAAALPPFWDRTGAPIDLTTWTRLFSSRGYRILEHHRVADVDVTTVWLGVEQIYTPAGQPPLIFGTLVHDLATGSSIEHFTATEAEARATHTRAIADLER